MTLVTAEFSYSRGVLIYLTISDLKLYIYSARIIGEYYDNTFDLFRYLVTYNE